MITNLHLAKHRRTGIQVKPHEIRVGLEVTFPSGAGGVIPCVCTSVTSDQAQFQSTNKEWPSSYVMEFNQPDFSVEDFEHLAGAIKRIDGTGLTELPGDREILRKAVERGYAWTASYTQCGWTGTGAELANELNHKKAS